MEGLSRKPQLSENRPSWALWQKGHSEAEERPREESGCSADGRAWRWVG